MLWLYIQYPAPRTSFHINKLKSALSRSPPGVHAMDGPSSISLPLGRWTFSSSPVLHCAVANNLQSLLCSRPQAHARLFYYDPSLGGNRWVTGCEHFRSSTAQPQMAFQEPRVRWYPCPQSAGCLVPAPHQPLHPLQVGEEIKQRHLVVD